MTASVTNFIRAAIIYLAIGTTMGVIMVLNPTWAAPVRTAHAHINLIGWVSMMIFGVGYHVLPRFRGKQLYSERLAMVQLVLANIGLIGLAVFLTLFNIYGGDALRYTAGFFGAVQAVSFYLFIYNMLKTM